MLSENGGGDLLTVLIVDCLYPVYTIKLARRAAIC